MLTALVLVAALVAYLVWWEGLFEYGKRPPEDQHPPLDATFKFNAPIAKLMRLIAGSSGNYAVTLPHPFKRRCIVFVAKHYITAAHRAHEVDGHGRQICTMGPVDYTATYLWHVLLRRGVWKDHMMEKEAEEREAKHADKYRPLGSP